MKKEIIFKGVGTALVTPMKDGGIDYSSLEKIIEMQISSGVDALIVGGTTAEAATLSDKERYELFRFAKERTKSRCKLVFGTGTNDTKKAVEHTRLAEEIGCDGVLVVTPYYNKGTELGIVKHYENIAENTKLPIIVYNVPARTGVNLSLTQLEELSQTENIVAIKEASDSLDRLVALSLFGESLGIYSGCDSQIYATLALGGLGVISVVSNVYPKETVKLCTSFFNTDTAYSLHMQQKLLKFINALFVENNPAPIKYAMWKKGLLENELRLPLSSVNEKTERLIDREMEKLELFD